MNPSAALWFHLIQKKTDQTHIDKAMGRFAAAAQLTEHEAWLYEKCACGDPRGMHEGDSGKCCADMMRCGCARFVAPAGPPEFVARSLVAPVDGVRISGAELQRRLEAEVLQHKLNAIVAGAAAAARVPVAMLEGLQPEDNLWRAIIERTRELMHLDDGPLFDALVKGGFPVALIERVLAERPGMKCADPTCSVCRP